MRDEGSVAEKIITECMTCDPRISGRSFRLHWHGQISRQLRWIKLGITAGFINFNQTLPDVHIFKYNADGRIELIQAVFGGRQQGLIWPDEKK